MLIVLRSQSCLMLEGRARTLSGPSPDLSQPVLFASAVIYGQVVIVLAGLITDVGPAVASPVSLISVPCATHTATARARDRRLRRWPVCMTDEPCRSGDPRCGRPGVRRAGLPRLSGGADAGPAAPAAPRLSKNGATRQRISSISSPGQRITRGMLPPCTAATCINSTTDSGGSADCTGISRPFGPRAGPRLAGHRLACEASLPKSQATSQVPGRPLSVHTLKTRALWS